MKKFIISFFTLFIILLSYTTYASTYTFTAEADKTTVNPGDEVTILLKVSNINAGSKGINVVETTLEYDNSIFESLDFIDKNDWKPTYNTNSGNRFGKLLYTKMVSGVTTDEEIGILRFKLKDNLDEMQTQIKLLQVTSNDGYSLMNDGDKIITLNIVKSPKPITPDPVNPTPEEPTPEEPTPEEPTPDNSTKPSTPEKDSGSVSGVQTGDIIGFIIGILLIVIVINFVIYICLKHKKSSKEN